MSGRKNMKTILTTLFAVMMCTASFAEKTITGVWFEIQLDGKTFVCTTQIEAKEDKSRGSGPILVFPITLKDHCSVGAQGGAFLITHSGSTPVPPPDQPWLIQFRDLRIQAEPGFLYVVRADGNEYRLRSIPFPSSPDAPGPLLKERVLAVLQ